MTPITAAVVREPRGRFTLETLQLDEPRDDEVRVRIAGTGLCHTDLSIRDQQVPFPLPAVLGHEGAGVVEAVGTAVRSVRPGDHVVLSFASCGRCAACDDGRPPYCESGRTLNFSGRRGDGSGVFSGASAAVTGRFFGQSSFASHALVQQSGVVRIADDVPLQLMGPLACGLQTGAGAIFNVLKPVRGSSIAIFGVGTVGLAAVMAARIAGCARIIAVDQHAGRLALARELGATDAIDASTAKVVREILALSGGGVHCSVECTAQASVLEQAVRVLRPAGSCVLLGMAAPDAEVRLNMLSLLNGRSLRGVMEGDSVPQTFIPRLIELWRCGEFPFERLVRYFPLSDINEAVAAAERGELIKAILTP